MLVSGTAEIAEVRHMRSVGLNGVTQISSTEDRGVQWGLATARCEACESRYAEVQTWTLDFLVWI